MTAPSAIPPLVLFHREGCLPCADLRSELPPLLDRRRAAGLPVPALLERAVDGDPELARRYGALVPVLRCGDAELTLVTSARQAARFLERILDGAG